MAPVFDAKTLRILGLEPLETSPSPPPLSPQPSRKANYAQPSDSEDDMDDKASEDEEIADLAPTQGKGKRKRTADDEGPITEIEVLLDITPVTEMSKPKTKRRIKKMTFHFALDEPWDTMKAQILSQVTKVGGENKKVPPFECCDVLFSVKDSGKTTKLSLTNEADFKTLKDRAAKLPRGKAQIHLFVDEHEEDKQADGAEKENSNGAKGGKRSGAGSKASKQASKVLPVNERKSEFIKQLKEKYYCRLASSVCSSTHCFELTGGKHLPLNFNRLECWATSLLKGDSEESTLEKPPNHSLFDINQASTLKPDILEERQKMLAAKNAPAVAQPIINVHIPQMPSASLQQATNSGNSDQLLPPDRLPGASMPLVAFCQQYELDGDILKKLEEHKFRQVEHLRFTTLPVLEKMGLHFGEVAALQHAVENWSVPRT
ncbi:hypothetical protein CONPUDRAFT_150340 [Coniophora puteana RWD-64-598 SS2]|uniref:Uncharacterized protein n=1 Tax=Coniophora puteana (strain RWD-64-598) TaxID=741705 RepID=A0A5M3N2C5_CONPW|nr:uncharacterized protein CONPUDRAFT_150340 [Coniophora puteana RWD-64-598 SS2]EIW85533.1 hypothetical protein CONPUDRAFT_150340 [Coniophora puteana RWD-64-598 SS2]